MFKVIAVFSLILSHSKGFMFDQLSDKLRCQGILMLCPPMCLKQDSNGCSTCDCSYIDPSHPKLPGSGSTGGNNKDPSNPLSGHNNFPGSGRCEDWTKCACVPTVNAATGCLECPCGQIPGTNMFTTSKQPEIAATNVAPSSTVAPVTSGRTTNKTMSSSQSNTKPSSHFTMGISPFSHTSLTSTYMTSSSTKKPAFSPLSTQRVTFTPGTSSAEVTSTEMDTNLPSVATVPSMNNITTMILTSTLAPFVCPGIFSCSLDCYAGFEMDKNGCPLCQCSAIPTDLP